MKRSTLWVVVGFLVASACGKSSLGERPGWNFVTDAGSRPADASPPAEDVGHQPDDSGGTVCEGSGVELCGDGVDDDCDGVPDDGCACDYDGKTVGICAHGVVGADGRCLAPEAWEFDELACDGRDNDCDGLVDEGCLCDAGDAVECFNGPAETLNVGACKAGVVQCVDGVLGGECVGEVVPRDETCDDVDDDCDGVVDEGCSCAYANSKDGVCANAVIDDFGNCLAPADYQNPEVSCDGKDNDCDGAVDASCGCAFADSTVGVCAGAVTGPDGTCQEPADYQTDETVCDGKDNDCDGTTDEGCTCRPGETADCYDGPAGTDGVGICTSGTLTCVGGQFGPCEGQVTPGIEACNGTDDDCDGVVDEGCACDYQGIGVGICSTGLIDAGGACTAPPGYQAVETTCDTFDNDCDGVVDEGCRCPYNGSENGVCKNGTLDEAGTCQPPPEYEADETTCDGLNNDCNGGIDEGCPCLFRGGTLGVCADAVRNEGGQCSPPRGYMGGDEANCRDALDNDCNGTADCDDPNCAGRGMCP